MSWTAKKDIVILVISLFGFQVSQSWETHEWGGTFTQETICGLTGTTVTLTCSIWYPQTHDGQIIKVIKGLWYTKVYNGQPEDLTMDPQYSGRLDQRNCHGNLCTLSIKELRESDHGTYKFRFITNVDGGEYTVKTGVTLDMTAAQVHVIKAVERDSYTRASLSCHTSCTPATSLSWCWKRTPRNDDCLTRHWTKEVEIYLRPGEYITCAVEGYPLSASPPLYALEAPRVLSTKDEIMEGDSLTLTCRDDTPTSSGHRWCKKTGTSDCEVMSYGEYLFFSSIQSSDSAVYCCVVENDLGEKMSQPFVIDVKYVPRLPSISAIPSSNVRMGSSVSLTCSSDANPVASYFWSKDNEESPNFTGAVLNIINFQLHNEGAYHCEARNSRGSQNATLLLQAENFRSWSQGALTAVVVRCATVGIVLILLSVTVLLFWKKTTSKGRMHLSQPNTSEDSSRDQLEELVAFSDPSPIHANVTNDKTDQDENEYESVVDTVIKCGGEASG
ncbi:B-cell receptor CD22-like [Corythoichthys intestinalis]|uniref:B-cell receptor CD22-like n=1 Tax=Corythoichthys intestinalis TaxID=161448 RepID=UPI0025A6719A|nr:B-cell receptor CD22-like [Corythoichthys intestinalis]